MAYIWYEQSIYLFHLFSLIDSLLKCVRKQYIILKSSGMNTTEINEDYENIVNIVEDSREVAWADQTVTSDRDEIKSLDVIKNAQSDLSLMKTSSGNYSNIIVHWKFSVHITLLNLLIVQSCVD